MLEIDDHVSDLLFKLLLFLLILLFLESVHVCNHFCCNVLQVFSVAQVFEQFETLVFTVCKFKLLEDCDDAE